MSKTKPNIFEGRTKEWDSNQWQGRSKRQVEGNYKILDWTMMEIGLFLFGWFIVSVFSNFFN